MVSPVVTIFCSSELRFPNFSIKYFLQVIQISGSASLYYVVKSELPGPINVKLKQKILSTLLNGMFAQSVLPAKWNVAQAAQLGKANDKKGCKAVRLINLLDPMGKAFFLMVWQTSLDT